MTSAEIKEFKKYVRDTLMKNYDMNEVEAARAVRDSYLSKALEKDKDFVEHDTVEEWAEFIHDEISNDELLMMQRVERYIEQKYLIYLFGYREEKYLEV